MLPPMSNSSVHLDWGFPNDIGGHGSLDSTMGCLNFLVAILWTPIQMRVIE